MLATGLSLEVEDDIVGGGIGVALLEGVEDSSARRGFGIYGGVGDVSGTVV